MYCPRCGTQNDDSMKYCRSCGENLGVVSLLLARHLPAKIITKLDDFLEWKNERLRRDSISSAICGGIFLFLSIYHLATEGFSFTVGFTLICACTLFFWSIWYYLVYQRSLSPNKRTIDESRISQPEQMSSANTLKLSSPPVSVTESTTKHLDTVPRDKSSN